MDLKEYRDGLEAGIESLNANSADVQLLLVQLQEERARYVVAESLKQGREIQFKQLLPMWRFEPTSEQFTDRGGDGAYMYLYWRNGRGPRPRDSRPMQKKTYVGARPISIKLARAMVANLKAAEKLDREIRELESALRGSERSLAQVAGALIRVLDKLDPGNGDGP